jgi:hypothetical protein
MQECPPAVPDCTPGEYITRERWGVVGGLSLEEQRSHFALWVMLAAPLILGNDPRDMSEATRAILTAPHVLRVAADARVSAGRRSWRGDASESEGGAEVWRRELEDGCVALLLLNGGDDVALDVEARWARDVAPVPALPAECADTQPGCAAWAGSGECTRNAGFMGGACAASCPALCPAAVAAAAARAAADADASAAPLRARVADAWSGEELGVMEAGVIAHALPPHASRMLIVKLLPAEGGEGEEGAPLLRAVKRKKKGGKSKKKGGEGLKKKPRVRKGSAAHVPTAEAEGAEAPAEAPGGGGGARGAAAVADAAARAQLLLLAAALAVLWRRYGRGGAAFWARFAARGASGGGRQRRASTGGMAMGARGGGGRSAFSAL